MSAKIRVLVTDDSLFMRAAIKKLLAADTRFDVIGDVVNRAQRFEANAPKGGVLVGEQTYLATRDFIDYEARPGMMLKGVTQPVNAYVALRMKETKENP